MQDLLKRYVEPFVEVYEQTNPKPYNISWLDAQTLARQNANFALVINPAQPQNAIAQYVMECVDEVAKKMQTYPAKVIIYDNEKSNAMHINNNSLAISLKKIQTSTPEQLKASIAHELGHQQNNGLSIGVKIADVSFEMASGFAVGTATYNALSKNHNSLIANAGAFIAGSAAGFIAANLTKPLYAAFRRSQEFEADKISSQVNGLDAMLEVLQAKKPQKQQSFLDKIYAKHPSHAERIEALQNIAAEQNNIVSR
jgi:Zn-dependent protease with chaperone function